MKAISLNWRKKWMPKSFKELHKEKTELERKESLATMRGALDIIRIAAQNSTSWDEFTELLKTSIEKIDNMIGE